MSTDTSVNIPVIGRRVVGRLRAPAERGSRYTQMATVVLVGLDKLNYECGYMK